MTLNVILHTDAPKDALACAQQRHPGVNFMACDSYAALPDMIAQTQAEVVYSVRFAGTAGFPREAVLNSGSVKWVSVGGSGTDHLQTWDTDRVTVTNAAGVAADMMAEYTIGALLHFNLDFPRFRAAQTARRWVAGTVTPIEGKTIVIVGLGHTGQAIARRAKGLGMRTIGVRARPTDTPFVDEVHPTADLDVVLAKADCVALCVPLLDATRGMIGPTQVAMMKSDAVLVDVSRGGVVDQTALVSAMANGDLKGAALDVFETEPLPDTSPFWDMQNVIVTPHCSSVFDGWALKSVTMFCDNLDRYIANEPLQNIVDPRRGY